jgi:opacity protein-like surface antigen
VYDGQWKYGSSNRLNGYGRNKMNRKIVLLVGCVLSLASAGAQAQATGIQLRPDAGFYAGGGLGRSEARDFCNIGGACDSKDVTWNLFAGYQVNRHFAVELGYTDFGKAKSTGFVGGVATQVSTESTALELVAIGIVPLTDSFSIYGKLGMFRFDSDGTATGGLTGSSSDDGFEVTWGLGAEYSFSRNFATRFEWQRYTSIGSGIVGMPAADMSVLRLGARYRF